MRMGARRRCLFDEGRICEGELHTGLILRTNIANEKIELKTNKSGMLPGHIAGLYGRDECHLDLDRLAVFSHARMIHAEVVGVDRTKKEVGMSKSKWMVLI